MRVLRWTLMLGLLTGCGGAVALDDIPRDPDGGAATTNGDNANGANGGTNGGSGSQPGASGSTSGSTSGGTGTGASTKDAGAPSTPPSTALSCGDQTCTVGAESCCVDQSGNATCVPQGGSCSGFPLDCTTKANCPAGEVCCLTFQTRSASCAANCGGGGGPGGPGGGFGGAVSLCTTDADCPKGERCRDAPGGVGIKFCRPARGGGGGGGGGGGPGGGNGGLTQ